jgi:hypothetical protein
VTVLTHWLLVGLTATLTLTHVCPPAYQSGAALSAQDAGEPGDVALGVAPDVASCYAARTTPRPVPVATSDVALESPLLAAAIPPPAALAPPAPTGSPPLFILHASLLI